MKRLSNTYFLLAFAALVIFSSCGSDTPSDPEPTVKEKAVANLIAQVYSGPTVTFDGSVPVGDWTNFTITFTATSYTVGGVPTGYEAVWTNGTWTLSDAATTLSRTQGGTALAVTSAISDGGLLTMTFTIPDSGRSGRINDVSGTWTFVFN